MIFKINNINEYKNINMSKELWFKAVGDGNIELIREYLDNGFDINCKDKFEKTALELAFWQENLNLFKELLKHPNIDVNCKNGDNESLLYLSGWIDNINIIKELLKHLNVDINQYNGINKRTALMNAIDNYETEIAKELLKHPNIDVNIKDIDGNTALDYAKELNNNNIIKLLKEKGAIE